MNAHRSPLSRLRAALGSRRAKLADGLDGTGAPSAKGTGVPSAARARLAFAFGLSASLIAMVAIFVTSAAPASATEACPNEARREEQGAAGRALPDCRAYELVTPSETTPLPEHPGYFEGEPSQLKTNAEEPEIGEPGYGGSGELIAELPGLMPFREAKDGDGVVFGTREGWPNSAALCGCISRRTASGWVGENPLPRIAPISIFCLGAAGLAAFTPNLEKIVLWGGYGGERCGHDEPLLVPGENPEPGNFFLRDAAAGSTQLITDTPPGVTPTLTRFDALSADGSHVVFESEARLTEDTPTGGIPGYDGGHTNIYLWDSAQPHGFHLLTVLPNGEPVRGPTKTGAYLAGSMVVNLNDRYACNPGTLIACGEEGIEYGGTNGLGSSAELTHAISANGERILFYHGGELIGKSPSRYIGGGLYLREHSSTEQSSLAHGGATGRGTVTAGSNQVTSLRVNFAEAAGAITNGSNEVTGLSTWTGEFQVGLPISGEGIPAGTTITAKSVSTLTLSNDATETKPHYAPDKLTSSGTEGPEPFAAGQTITAKGIPTGTTITAVALGSLTLSTAATSSGSEVSLESSSECTESQKACTVQIDVPEGGSGSPGGGQFQWANTETSKIFFTDEERLTPDSTAESGKPDLYEYDLEKPQGQRLTDLTAGAAEPADVQTMAGMGEDGSHIYFVARGDLTGAQQNSQGGSALTPAEGAGELVGVAEGSGTLTTGSPTVTGVSGGPFAQGEEISGQGIPNGTAITSCTPVCSSPSELTLSNNATESGTVGITGLGSKEVTGLTTASGAFHVGMAISGTGIPRRTWITAVGSGTLMLSQRAELSGTQTLSASSANLYLRHGGATTFIAALNPVTPDHCDWVLSCSTARVSQNGEFIAFNSTNSLTGYDSNPVHHNACTPFAQYGAHPRWPCIEIFRYAAANGPSGELTCASCRPDGSPPAAEFGYGIEQAGNQHIPLQSPHLWLNHNMSNSGQVFFDTLEKFVPADENEAWDVYQYDGGEGPTAQLHLISTGKSEDHSYFYDASPSGRDVFFTTNQALVRSDSRSDYDAYDARAGGGFAEPLIPQCEAEGCHPAYPGAPGSSSPGSATFEGKGNLHETRCPKGKVRRHGKCVKQHKRHKKHHHRAARHNRGAGK